MNTLGWMYKIKIYITATMTSVKVRSGTGGIEWKLSGGGREIGVIICVQVCNWFTHLQPE